MRLNFYYGPMDPSSQLEAQNLSACSSLSPKSQNNFLNRNIVFSNDKVKKKYCCHRKKLVSVWKNLKQNFKVRFASKVSSESFFKVFPLMPLIVNKGGMSLFFIEPKQSLSFISWAWAFPISIQASCVSSNFTKSVMLILSSRPLITGLLRFVELFKILAVLSQSFDN